MKSKKQRTHLTPEEVQEFINLGVDFGETTCVWCETKHGYELQEEYEGYSKMELYENVEDWEIKSIIPAPNLQEVLGTLNLTIKINGWNRNLKLFTRNGEWKICYDFINVFISEDILIAVTDFLRWVCKNYPKTLIKKE